MTKGSWPKWAEPVMAFLAGKKLMIVPNIVPRSSQVITLNAALRVGRELEPRVLEVLPAAIIHFPANFRSLTNIPSELKAVIDAIIKDFRDGPKFEGMEFSEMKRWANTKLHDNRLVPAKDRRRMRSFRLSKVAIEALKKQAQKTLRTETEVIERLILQEDTLSS